MSWVLGKNYRRRNSNEQPEWIVIHYPAMPGANNIKVWHYFHDESHCKSSHYIVDSSGVQKGLDIRYAAYHVGGLSTSKNGCYNGNAIGVDLCDDKSNRRSIKVTDNDWFFRPETLKCASILIARLMRLYHIDIDHVVRHYDVTGKICPRPFVGEDNSYNFKGMKCNELWLHFKDMILIELSKHNAK